MTQHSKNPHKEPWPFRITREIAAYRRERLFTQDPPLSPGNPFRKGGPSYIPYPEDPEGNPIFHASYEQQASDIQLELPTHQLGD